MLPQQFQRPEPPNKVNIFMEKFGLPALLVVFTIIATIVGTVLLGKIQVLDFNWLMLILVLIIVAITIFLVWYYLRTIRNLQEKYQADLATLRRENADFKAEYRDLFHQEIARWHEWSIGYTQANAKEQTERLEELKHDYKEAIGDVKTELTTQIKYEHTHWTDWTNSHANAHKGEQQSYKRQLEALKETLTEKPLSERGN